jgi:hypothetical protein
METKQTKAVLTEEEQFEKKFFSLVEYMWNSRSAIIRSKGHVLNDMFETPCDEKLSLLPVIAHWLYQTLSGRYRWWRDEVRRRSMIRSLCRMYNLMVKENGPDFISMSLDLQDVLGEFEIAFARFEDDWKTEDEDEEISIK